MKLQLALVSCDLNPRYINFWPLVHRAWANIVGIRIILILIANEIPDNIEYKDDIILFPPIPNIHTAFQAQCIRILYPALLTNITNDGIIITDMDMIPMSHKFFCNNIAPYDNDNFITFFGPENELYICYNVATPTIWNDIFQVNTLKNLCDILISWNNSAHYSGHHGGFGWFTDQIKLCEYVKNWKKLHPTKFIKINKIPSRLDRSNNIPDINKIDVNRIKLYHDFHMNYPYDKYKNYLEEIYLLAAKYNSK